MKRLLDFILAAIALIALGPALLLIGVLVKLDSQGPVVYKGQRVGRRGKVFPLYKFRTMFLDSDSFGPAITSVHDSRITRVGKLLRKWKLDELPQLVNVLLGHISIVGPRPEAPKFVSLYTEEQKAVLLVRPGITGISQILFRHEEDLVPAQDSEDFYGYVILPQKLRLDLAYTQFHPLTVDFALMFATAIALVAPRTGARVGRYIAKRVWGLNLPDDSPIVPFVGPSQPGNRSVTG